MRILVIEPDTGSREHLENLVKEIAPEKKVVGHCSSVKASLCWFKEHPYPDLVFSAVELSDGVSFEIFRHLEKKIPVIFTCSNERYALDAFKANGIYYLLKPIKKDELREALGWYNEKFSRGPFTKQPPPSTAYQERFIVNMGQQLKLIRQEEIAYFYTENKLVYLVCADGSKYVINHSLEQLEQMLNPAQFFRINRQFIIHLSSIVKMMPASKSRVHVFLRPEADHNTITSFGRTDEFYKWLLGELR